MRYLTVLDDSMQLAGRGEFRGEILRIGIFQREEFGMRQTVVNGLLRNLKDRCQTDPTFAAKADRAESLAKAIENALWSTCGGGGKTYKTK